MKPSPTDVIEKMQHHFRDHNLRCQAICLIASFQSRRYQLAVLNSQKVESYKITSLSQSWSDTWIN